MNAHPTREEDFDLYALGALEGEEKLALESHAAVCEPCARKLVAARGRMALLAFAAPSVEPSPAVKQRLLAQIRAGEHPAGATPERTSAFKTAGAAEHRRHEAGTLWTAILAPAFCAVVLVSIFLWRDNARLERELAMQHALLADQQSQIDAAQSKLEQLMSHPQVVSAVWTGWISDSHCGAKGMTAAHKDCAMKCIKEMHSYWVFVDSKSKSVVKIHNQDNVNPETSLGAEMKVTGWMMDDGTLQVEKISSTR